MTGKPILMRGLVAATMLAGGAVGLHAAEPLVVSGEVSYPLAGSGHWAMEIDTEGNVIGSTKAAPCRLGSDELARLTALISVLPTGRSEYRYGKSGPADTKVRYTLSVRRAGKTRAYTYWKSNQGKAPDVPEVESVGRLWRFLRGLCQPKARPGPTPVALP